MLHRYVGPPAIYPQLTLGTEEAGTLRVAPFTVQAGSLVDFDGAEPPADGRWQPSKATGGAQQPDNHASSPDVLAVGLAALTAAQDAAEQPTADSNSGPPAGEQPTPPAPLTPES